MLCQWFCTQVPTTISITNPTTNPHLSPQFENDAEAAKWCENRFAEKETMLGRFDDLVSTPGLPSTDAVEVFVIV